MGSNPKWSVSPRYGSNKRPLRECDWESQPTGTLVAFNTTVTENWQDGRKGIRYHSTVIVLANGDGRFTLNTGGWHTSTTKQRMNALLWRYNIVIWQKDHVWYVSDSWGERLYEDGMTVSANSY